MPGQQRNDMSLGEAAAALGVSVDTLRRWSDSGKLRSHRDARNRRRVSASEVERLSRTPRRHRTGTAGSPRNRMPGRVRSVEVGGVMALVEIEAGAFLLTGAITRDPGQEPGPAPGEPATAGVNAAPR